MGNSYEQGDPRIPEGRRRPPHELREPEHHHDQEGLFDRAAEWTHGIVIAIFHILRFATRADQMLVFRALAESHPAEPGTERQALAIEAVREFHRQTGETSSKKYTWWVRDQAEPNPWPSMTQIRNRLGGTWEKVLGTALAEPVPDVLSRRLHKRGDKIPAEDVYESTLAFADETDGPIARIQYAAWCKAENARPEGERRWARLPETAAPLHRLGGWAKILEDLDLLGRRVERVGPLHKDKRNRGPIHQPPPLLKDIDWPAQLEWLRRAAHDLGLGLLSMATYDAWRAARIRSDIARDQYVFVPGGQALANHFGNFGRALAAAGIISEDDALLRAHQGTYSHQELVETLMRCAVELRRAPTVDRYERWRRQRRRELAQAGEPPKVASSALLQQRLGERTWKGALEVALGLDHEKLHERLAQGDGEAA